MQPGVPTKVIAAIFALAGFAVAVIAGLAAGNPASRVLVCALTGMLICHALGLGAGALGERIVNDHLGAYRAARPVPDTNRTAPAGPKDSGARNAIRA